MTVISDASEDSEEAGQVGELIVPADQARVDAWRARAAVDARCDVRPVRSHLVPP